MVCVKLKMIISQNMHKICQILAFNIHLNGPLCIPDFDKCSVTVKPSSFQTGRSIQELKLKAVNYDK